MSRILFINSVCNGSTGNICKNLYKLAEQEGHTCCIAYGRGEQPEGFNTIKIGNQLDIYMHVLKARLFDASGFGSKRVTKEFIKKINEFKPDIIHLHNIHGYYINIEILFSYLKEHPEIKKIWTLHDCWPYTGHCACYLYNKCYKWEECCQKCKFKKNYPNAWFSFAKNNFNKKREIFSCVDNMELVLVSNWLKEEVNNSFLKQYKLQTIISGIDTTIFKYTDSQLKAKLNINDKTIILGVANVWTVEKGLTEFIKLSNILSNKYQIILVGLNNTQLDNLPSNIIGIERTKNQQELAEYYSMADIFFNPTKEETYGLTNVEAQACGTTVVTYDSGGTIETLKNSNTYIVSDVETFIKNIETYSIEKNLTHQDCFDKNKSFMKYMELYKLMGDK